MSSLFRLSVGLLSVLFLFSVSLAGADNGIDPQTKAKVIESYGKIPLYFIKNEGQMDKRVVFL